MYTPLTKQVSFSGLELKLLDKSKTARFLERVNALIDWALVERRLKPLYCLNNGRPGHNPLVLFKALLLEQWYALSDQGVEEELKDRLSFRNFVGLKGSEAPPDETTLVRFRAKLRERGFNESLFNFIKDQLRSSHTEVKAGQWLLTDATLVAAPFGVKPKGQDGNGDFTRRKDHVLKGYKAHLVKDQKDGLIESSLLTTASCHESGFLETLLAQVQVQVAGVIGDKGYAQADRKRSFRQQGIYYGILEKRHRHQAHLSQKQKRRNKLLARVRAKIEQTFSVFKQRYGWTRVRYFGLPRNTEHLWGLCLAYNLQHVANQPPRLVS